MPHAMGPAQLAAAQVAAAQSIPGRGKFITFFFRIFCHNSNYFLRCLPTTAGNTGRIRASYAYECGGGSTKSPTKSPSSARKTVSHFFWVVFRFAFCWVWPSCKPDRYLPVTVQPPHPQKRSNNFVPFQ